MITFPEQRYDGIGAYCDDYVAQLAHAVASIDRDKLAEAAELLPDDHAKHVSETKLDRVLGTGYGIFSGERTRIAVLRFSPNAARWVSQEQWHSRQKGYFDGAGYYRLTVPYTNATELVMDILRHGPDVEVLQPRALRQQVEDQLAETIRLYSLTPSSQLP